MIVCDATFYGKKKDKIGTLVFKDILSKEVLLWKHVQSELGKDYKQLLYRLLDLGYDIQAVIINGKRGLYKVFKEHPIQMCHFYQKKIVQRYITLHPRLETGIDLQKIVSRLTQTTEKKIKIHNTTNAIDGGLFSPMKKLLKIHNGFTKSLKLKMVDDYLVSYKKK